MKTLTVLSVVVASLLLIGCGEEAKAPAEATTPATTEKTEATSTVAEKATKAVEATKEAVTVAAEKAKEAVADAKEAVAQKATTAVEATKEAASVVAEKATAVAEKASAAATEAKEAVAEKVEDAKKAIADKTAGAEKINLTACAACHGADFEKKAMGVSKIVKDMTVEEIVTALNGYKDGSYGGNMKTLMKGQVGSFDEAKIKAIATQIGK